MGIGSGQGENRAAEAARTAVSSPLLESSIEGATGILLNISGPPDLGLFEVNEAAEVVTGAADQNANVIFGAVIDENLARRGAGDGDRDRLRRPAPPPCAGGRERDTRRAEPRAGVRRRRLARRPVVPARRLRFRAATPGNQAAALSGLELQSHTTRSEALSATLAGLRPLVTAPVQIPPCAVPGVDALASRRRATGQVVSGSGALPPRRRLASRRMQTLRRTPLYDRHVALGARMVPFAGWEMPVQYEGVIPEHRAVRTDAGVFDVSHMGELEVEGPTRARPAPGAALERRRQARAGRRAVHAAHERRRRDHRRPDRLPPRAITGTCSSSTRRTRDADFEWLKEHELRGSDVRDVSDDYALLAVQGPRALERLGLERAPRRSPGRWASSTASR